MKNEIFKKDSKIKTDEEKKLVYERMIKEKKAKLVPLEEKMQALREEAKAKLISGDEEEAKKTLTKKIKYENQAIAIEKTIDMVKNEILYSGKSLCTPFRDNLFNQPKIPNDSIKDGDIINEKELDDFLKDPEYDDVFYIETELEELKKEIAIENGYPIPNKNNEQEDEYDLNKYLAV